MGRLARSWELVRLCWRVLRQDEELVVFPILSTIGVLIVTASFVVPGFFTGFWQGVSDEGGAPKLGDGLRGARELPAAPCVTPPPASDSVRSCQSSSTCSPAGST